MSQSVSRRPSVGYYICMAAAMVGLICLAVAIEGTRLALRNEDGLGAFNQAGVPALVVAWALAVYARLAFSDKVSPSTQSAVRTSLRIVFGAEILIAAIGSWFILGSPESSSDLRGILIAGDLLQVGTLVWILRYSAE